MTKYKIRYTTPYGLQILQEFLDKESRDRALELIERTICIEAVDEDVDNTADDFVGERDCAES